MSYGLQDVLRRKVLYLIAFTAVFICILSNLLIDVVVKKASYIFVTLSEDLQIDAQIKPSMRNRDKIENHFHLNFTRIEELKIDPEIGTIVPRITMEAINHIRGRYSGLYDDSFGNMENYSATRYESNHLAPYSDIYGPIEGSWSRLRTIFFIDT